MPKPVKWIAAIERRGNDLIFKQAWRKAQKIRALIERKMDGFFKELVTIGVDVPDAPDLGEYTPSWEPLTDDWAARKGHEEFYYHTGALERALLRKSTQSVFGRPQVFLEWPGHSVKVNAGEPAKKYVGSRLTGLKVRAVPFPRVGHYGDAEELVAGGNVQMFYKLTGPSGTFQRPLVSPFVNWYVHVKIKQLMRGKT